MPHPHLHPAVRATSVKESSANNRIPGTRTTPAALAPHSITTHVLTLPHPLLQHIHSTLARSSENRDAAHRHTCTCLQQEPQGCDVLGQQGDEAQSHAVALTTGQEPATCLLASPPGAHKGTQWSSILDCGAGTLPPWLCCAVLASECHGLRLLLLLLAGSQIRIRCPD